MIWTPDPPPMETQTLTQYLATATPADLQAFGDEVLGGDDVTVEFTKYRNFVSFEVNDGSSKMSLGIRKYGVLEIETNRLGGASHLPLVRLNKALQKRGIVFKND